MPFDPPDADPRQPGDIAIEALYNAQNAIDFEVGRNLRRLKQYGVFYRRLRTRQRIGALLQRAIDVMMVDFGGILGLLAAGWGALDRRLRRRKKPDTRS